MVILAAHWDHHDVGEEIADRMGATLVVLPGQTGAQDSPGEFSPCEPNLSFQPKEACKAPLCQTTSAPFCQMRSLDCSAVRGVMP